MATISCSSPSSLFFSLLRTPSPPSPSLPLLSPSFPFSKTLSVSLKLSFKPLEASRRTVKALAEETEGLLSEGGDELETAITEEGAAGVTSKGEAESEEAPVSVPVSPSDILIMFFKAEGTMAETEIPALISVLEKQDSIADWDVTCEEGVATVEIVKETTVQATGVASGLVELLQTTGFKLQSLSLSFEDEEDVINDSMIELEEEEKD